MNKAAVLRIESLRDHPDTVYVVRGIDLDSPRVGCRELDVDSGISGMALREAEVGSGSDRVDTFRRSAAHSAVVQSVREHNRKVENFRFNPNTISVEDLQRLGFSAKQAQSIENYRAKGGRFRRKSDFAKSFVVSEEVFRRLEPYIDIPLLDINKADSADFDGLPGIGPYFAAKMVEYRGKLGGYSYAEQLMDIRNLDAQKFDALADLVYCSAPLPFRLWQLPADSLRCHPYIGGWKEAEAIVLIREKYPSDSLNVGLLRRAGILSPKNCDRLAKCLIADPD